MIDKKKVLIWGAVAAVVIVGLIVGIISVGMNASRPAPSAEAPASSTSEVSSTPEPTASESAEAPSQSDEELQDPLSFDEELKQVAMSAVITASDWEKLDSKEQRISRYKKNHFAPELAETFRPVWSDVFTDDLNNASIYQSRAERVWVSDVTGEPGNRTYRVGAIITYNGSWNDGAPHNITKGDGGTWWLTLDEATQQVTAIDQPAAAEVVIPGYTN